MAPKELKKGQKQIDSENQQTLKFYQNIILAVLGIYGIYIVYFLPGWPYYLLMALTSLIYLGCYKFMDSMVRGGMDLALPGGMAEHAKDLLLVTAIVQFLSIITNYALLIWLVVPARALYLLWVNILAPWFFAEPPSEMMDEKKQKKMERKMKRQQAFR